MSFLPTWLALALAIVLWLPLLAALGAGHTLLAWRVGRRRGPGALAGVWGVTSLVSAAAAGALAWAGAALLAPLAVCYGAATLAARRYLAAPARRPEVALAGAGASASAAAWVGCGVLAAVAARIAA